MLELAESRWRKQVPDTPVEIDWNHDLAGRLLFVTSGGARGYDMVTGRYPSSGSFTNKNGKFGEALGFGVSTQLAYPHADDIKFASGYTMLVFGRTTSLAAQSGMVAKWDGTGNNVPMTFFVRSSGELALWRNVGGGNNGTYGTTTTMGGTTGQSVISTNVDFVASVDAGSTVLGAPNLYLNGALRNSGWTFGPTGSNVALSEPSGSTFAIGASNGGTSTWQGHLYLVVGIIGRLPVDEQLDLHEYPGQLFRREVRRTYFDGGAGGDQTISLGDTAAGADAFAIAVSLAMADTGAGAEGFGAAASVPLADTGAGSDAIGVTMTMTLADTGAGTDASTIAASFTLADTGTGADAVSVLTATLISIAESVSAVDTVGSVTVQVTLSESAAGTEAIAITALVAVLESASGMDVAIVVNPAAPRVVRLVFTPKGRSAQFTLRGRSTIFTLN
jgi:hypothetical protein